MQTRHLKRLACMFVCTIAMGAVAEEITITVTTNSSPPPEHTITQEGTASVNDTVTVKNDTDEAITVEIYDGNGGKLLDTTTVQPDESTNAVTFGHRGLGGVCTGTIPRDKKDGVRDETCLWFEIGEAIPAVSQWGLILMVVMLCVAGSIVFGRRRAVQN